MGIFQDRQRILMGVVVVIMAAIAIFYVVGKPDNSDEDQGVDTSLPARLQEIQTADKLVIGTAITRPFEYRNDENQLIGFDISLMEKFAQELGVSIEWKEMAFADLITELEAGNVDVVIAGMYITPVRQEVVDFAEPYLDTGLVMVTRTDAAEITSPEDLAGRTVGVKEGATGEVWAEQFRTEDEIELEIRQYTDTLDSLDDLDAGQIDVVFNDKLNTLEYIKTHPDIQIQGEVFAPAGLGIAVQKGDADLLAFINETLADLKAKGEIQKLFDQWINPETAS